MQPTTITAKLSLPWEASSPAVNSSESPGRKNPTSSPDSMKTIANSPIVPNVSRRECGDRLKQITASWCRRPR